MQTNDVFLTNRAKAALTRGECVVGTMVCELASAAVPRMLAQGGMEFVIFDAEHGVFTTESIADLAAASRLCGITPIVRIPEIRRETVSRTLDLGAQGILVPQVRHEDEVSEVVRYAKFSPIGERGVALGRTHSNYAKGDASEWMARLNASTLVMIQIETSEALDRLEAIASVPGIDGLFIGPNDLASSLGVPGKLDHPRVVEAFERVIAACNSRSLVAGTHLFDPGAARAWKAKGIRLLTVGNDISMIVEGSRRLVEGVA